MKLTIYCATEMTYATNQYKGIVAICSEQNIQLTSVLDANACLMQGKGRVHPQYGCVGVINDTTVFSGTDLVLYLNKNGLLLC